MCLMKQHVLKARWKRKFVHTIDSRHELPTTSWLDALIRQPLARRG